jgi:hypothetical protein
MSDPGFYELGANGTYNKIADLISAVRARPAAA